MGTIFSDVPFLHRDQFYANGEWRASSGDGRFTVITPATEIPYVQVAEATEDDMRRAVAAARDAFDTGPWPRLSHQERAGFLEAIGRRLIERTSDISQVWPHEAGIVQSVAEMLAPGGAEAFFSAAAQAKTFQFERRMHPAGGGALGLLIREPVGVVAAIIPWNAPILLAAHKLAPALLAGCTVILKASPEAPGICYILAEIMHEIGLPPGVFNLITADREVSEMLVCHPGVDKVSFTGSTGAGRRIASLLGERVARYTLELGGKSAAIVFDDYDVDAVAEALVGPTCLLSGQACSSLTRIIISHDRREAMAEALASRFATVRIGDPFDPTVGMGPVALRRQRDRIAGLIGRAKHEGATIVCGGNRPADLDRGYFIAPTVISNVDNSSEIAQTEIFGPVLTIIGADSDSNAIDLANQTIYGLNNSVFTYSPDLAYSGARKLRSGTVGHNNFRTDFSIAFGGFKQSGIGREGADEGLLSYLETKTVILEGTPAHLR